jgi:hypothetical protein
MMSLPTPVDPVNATLLRGEGERERERERGAGGGPKGVTEMERGKERIEGGED